MHTYVCTYEPPSPWHVQYFLHRQGTLDLDFVGLFSDPFPREMDKVSGNQDSKFASDLSVPWYLIRGVRHMRVTRILHEGLTHMVIIQHSGESASAVAEGRDVKVFPTLFHSPSPHGITAGT